MLHLLLRRLARDQWVRLHGTPRVTVLVGGAHGREIWEQWIAVTGLPGTLLDGFVEVTSDATYNAMDHTAPPQTPEQRFEERIRAAVARAVEAPAHPIAVAVAAEVAERWRRGRHDRLAALVDEGWIAVPERPAPDPDDGDGAWDPEEVTAALPPGGSPDDASVADRAAYDPRDVVDDGPGRARRGRDDGDADGATVPPQFYLDARSVAEATLFEALEATPSTAGRFRLNESLSVRFGPMAAEVDLLSRTDGIAIEIDGMHHFSDLVCYRRDRRKDLLLQTQGFVVVRLLAEDVVRDVQAAVNVVNQALAYRLGAARG